MRSSDMFLYELHYYIFSLDGHLDYFGQGSKQEITVLL